jgi:hypothetical protein
MTNKEFMSHGYTHISNTGGIEIMFNKMQDAVYYRFVPDPDEEIFEAEILYDENDEPYFKHGEVEYHLNTFMRATDNNF